VPVKLERKMAKDDFTVKFGNLARTVEYDDTDGHIVFTFDLGSAGAKSVCLEHFSPRRQRVPRYHVAFNRVKDFLESSGYQIEIYGDFASLPSMEASDITNRIQTEIASNKLPKNSRIPIGECLISPTRSEFKLYPENTIWDMWLVLEEPIHGLRIVFDEYTKKFGVAKQDVFLGFEGTFLQTLDAVSKA
jgi:hypothetical protein